MFDQYISSVINDAIQKHSKNLVTESKLLIPETNIYTNSLNIYVGPQGCGKSYSIMKDVLKISLIDPNVHLIIYINNTEDETVNSIKSLIKIPFISITRDKAEEFVKELLKFKNIYNNIIKEDCVNEVDYESKQLLFNKLYINDFSRTHLNTLIILDDTSQSELLKNKSYFNDLFTKCRHIQCSFFLAIQYWRSLNTNIKSNASTIYIFSGYSKQQFNYITYQLPLNMSSDELYQIYLENKKIIILDGNVYLE